MAKIMMRLGIAPKIPSTQNIKPGSFPSKSAQSSIGSVLNLGTKTTGSTQQHLLSDSPHQESISSSPESKETSSLFGSRSVKFIYEFLQNPVLNKEETKVSELVSGMSRLCYLQTVIYKIFA